MSYFRDVFTDAEELMRDARMKRFNYISDKVDALFDRDKEEDLKLKEELKNDSTR